MLGEACRKAVQFHEMGNHVGESYEIRDQGGKIKMSGKFKVKMCSRGGQKHKRLFAEALTLLYNQKG